MIHETRTSETTTQAGVRRMPGLAEEAHGPSGMPLLRLSWGALIAGAVVAIATQVLLAVLGVAIGLSLGAVEAESFAIGTGIWWLIASIIALFAGGFVAGRFSYIRHPFHSSMHGVMTWCLVTVLSIFFVGWMGGVVAAGPMASIVDDLAPQQTQAGMQQMQQEMGQAGQQQLDPEAATTGAAWWTFIALLLGVAAAGLGGYLAAPQNLREAGMMNPPRTPNEAEA